MWQRSARPAVTAAELARDLVLSQTEHDDAQRRASVAAQVDDAVDGLERAAASAPDDATRALSERSAESLRGLAFAVEADHLMRSGGERPTGEQLAAADQARRHRKAELDAALAELKAAVSPPRTRTPLGRGHSERSMSAVGVRAAVRAGIAATTLARISVPTTTRTMAVTDTVGYGTA